MTCSHCVDLNCVIFEFRNGSECLEKGYKPQRSSLMKVEHLEDCEFVVQEGKLLIHERNSWFLWSILNKRYGISDDKSEGILRNEASNKWERTQSRMSSAFSKSLNFYTMYAIINNIKRLICKLQRCPECRTLMESF